MKLIAIYAVLVVLGETAVVGLGEVVEVTYPSASLLTFLAMFFSMLWLAWIVALRLTRE